MRWHDWVTTSALILVAVFFCLRQPAQKSPLPGQPLTVHGYTTIRTTDPHTIEVAVDVPEHPDGRADHVFYLSSNETLPAVDRYFPSADVELTAKELRVLPDGGEEVIILALKSAPPRAESAPRSVRYTGYGLQHQTGKNAFMQVRMTRR